MLNALMIIGGGLLGSAHCVGMCGGFVVAIGESTPTLRRNLWDQLSFSAGRVFTYTFLGATAGALGVYFQSRIGPLLNVQAALAVVAGVTLVGVGLHSAGWLPVWKKSSSTGCLSQSFLSGALGANGALGRFAGGILVGFLPCGLVYGFLALALSSGSLWRGAVIMGLFGIGTVPALVATGCGAGMLGPFARRRLFHFAACLLLVTGAITLCRGVVAFINAAEPAAICPFCA